MNVEHCGASMSKVATHRWCNAATLSSQVSAAIFPSPSVGVTQVWSHYLIDEGGQDNRRTVTVCDIRTQTISAELKHEGQQFTNWWYSDLRKSSKGLVHNFMWVLWRHQQMANWKVVLFNHPHVQCLVCMTVTPRWLDACGRLPGTFNSSYCSEPSAPTHY